MNSPFYQLISPEQVKEANDFRTSKQYECRVRQKCALLEWRVVKVAQLKLACLIYINEMSQDDSSIELENLLVRYSALEDDDREVAEPVELRNALISKASNYASVAIQRQMNAIIGLCMTT